MHQTPTIGARQASPISSTGSARETSPDDNQVNEPKAEPFFVIVEAPPEVTLCQRPLHAGRAPPSIHAPLPGAREPNRTADLRITRTIDGVAFVGVANRRILAGQKGGKVVAWNSVRRAGTLWDGFVGLNVGSAPRSTMRLNDRGWGRPRYDPGPMPEGTDGMIGRVAATRPRPRIEKFPRCRCSALDRDEIISIAGRRGVSNVRVFGSVARGDAGPDSDIDLLVDFDPTHHGLDLFGFEREVEELLGHPVEVGTEVHRAIREKVDASTVLL